MAQAIATSNIVAQAFRYMEMSPISSLGEGSEEAQAAAEQYPNAIAMLLEIADWSFASVARTLPVVAGLPAGLADDPERPYLFVLPGECIALREVGDPRDMVTWRLEKSFLRADHSGPLPVRFTAQISNEEKLPAGFRNAVSLQLAALLAPRWVHSHTKTQGLEDRLQRAIAAALHADARMASPERLERGSSHDWAREAVQ